MEIGHELEAKICEETELVADILLSLSALIEQNQKASTKWYAKRNKENQKIHQSQSRSIKNNRTNQYLKGKKRKAPIKDDCTEIISVQDRKGTKDSKIKYDRKQKKGKHELYIQYGENLVDYRIKVWWEDDHQFYEGVIASFDHDTKKHKVIYDDGDIEVLNLDNETWELVNNGIINLNTEYEENLVDSKIKVWWEDDHQFYEGVIASFNPVNKKHKVLYDDGDIEILNLKNETWEFVDDGANKLKKRGNI